MIIRESFLIIKKLFVDLIQLNYQRIFLILLKNGVKTFDNIIKKLTYRMHNNSIYNLIIVTMCGIWFYLQKHAKSLDCLSLYSAFKNIQHRGPDRSSFEEVLSHAPFYIGFHRLAIVDVRPEGDQPFKLTLDDRTLYCICNGEIYGYEDLKIKYNLETKSRSDCEVIPLLYAKLGMDEMMKVLCGEFSFIIIEVYHDVKKIDITACSDRFGIRPMYYGEDTTGICFSSEKKGFIDHNKEHIIESGIKHFPSAHYIKITWDNNNISKSLHQYYSHDYTDILITDLEQAQKEISSTLHKIVSSMVHGIERPYGALLSGGLDSSLIVAILSEHHKEKFNKKLRTFSIGMKGSTDYKYAKMVSDYVGTEHTHVEYTNKDFLDIVESGEVTRVIGTFDTTTNRASTGQLLISKYVRNNTDIKILFIGDGSDEITGGYLENLKAPNDKEFNAWCKKRLREIHEYDVRRADRCIANAGLEARVPFLHHNFVDLYMSIDPKLRMPYKGMEKWLLRSSFEKEKILPREVLYRKKEAFSDGVSSVEDSWHKIIQNKAKELYSDDILDKENSRIKYCPPKTYEELYFRHLFEKYYGIGDIANSVEFGYWKFNEDWVGKMKEVSARGLSDIY